MHPDMLPLAERLVIAMEAMSQDVKNMSAYVFDISCSVSYLVNQRREKQSIPGVAYDGCVDSSSVTPAAEQVSSEEGAYPGQYEQTDEKSLSYIGDLEYEESSFGDIPCTSIDPHENSDVLSSENSPFFTGGIKIEGAESEVNDQSCRVHDVYGNSRNNVRLSKETEAPTEIEREDHAYGLHATIDHSVQELTDHNSFEPSLSEGQTSLARSHLMESTKYTLMAATGVDSEEKPYKCSLCEKSFKTCGGVVKHTRLHTGEKPYKCGVCGKAFSLNCILTEHMRTHTDERPFRCDVCGNAFRQKSHLINHMRSHTDERPYMCYLCGKAFRYTNSLKKHILSHYRHHPN